jgi:hypothetical protein
MWGHSEYWIVFFGCILILGACAWAITMYLTSGFRNYEGSEYVSSGYISPAVVLMVIIFILLIWCCHSLRK